MKTKHILLLGTLPLLRIIAIVTTYLMVERWELAVEGNPVFGYLFETIGFWPSIVMNCILAGVVIFGCFYSWDHSEKFMRWEGKCIGYLALVSWGADAINNLWYFLA